jgi:hypothetical protein
MKKKVLIGVAVVVVILIGVVVAALNTDSPECEEMKTAICDYCGAESPACEKLQGAITTTEECVEAMDMFKGSEEMLKLGGDAAKKAFCDGVAK